MKSETIILKGVASQILQMSFPTVEEVNKLLRDFNIEIKPLGDNIEVSLDKEESKPKRYRVKTEDEMIRDFGEDWQSEISKTDTYNFVESMIDTLGMTADDFEYNPENKGGYRLSFKKINDFWFYNPEWLVKL